MANVLWTVAIACTTNRRDRLRAVASVNERSTAMSGKTDQIKGRIKEAAGVLTDNERLKRKGKLDQAVGKVKETAEKAPNREMVRYTRLVEEYPAAFIHTGGPWAWASPLCSRRRVKAASEQNAWRHSE